MKLNVILKWLRHKWQGQRPELISAYRLTFETMYGQVVIQHLLDSIYCTVYEGTDPNEALAHNARRSVVHDILMNIDIAQNPQKYEMPTGEGETNV